MRVQAPFGRRRAVVTGARDVGAYRVLESTDPGGPQPWPGQFYMLAAAERWGGGDDERPFLPRAFSVARVAPNGDLEFMLEDVEDNPTPAPAPAPAQAAAPAPTPAPVLPRTGTDSSVLLVALYLLLLGSAIRYVTRPAQRN